MFLVRMCVCVYQRPSAASAKQQNFTIYVKSLNGFSFFEVNLFGFPIRYARKCVVLIWIQHFSGVLLLILLLKLVSVGDFPRFQKWNVINNLKVGAREFNQRRHYNTLSRVRTHHDESLIWLSRKDNSICNSGGINDELSLIYLTALHNICSTMSINVKWH